jgi:hypothetical protein
VLCLTGKSAQTGELAIRQHKMLVEIKSATIAFIHFEDSERRNAQLDDSK